MAYEETKRRGPIMAEYLSPGPLAYQMKTGVGAKEHTITKQQAPSYSLGMRNNPKPNELPGPCYAFDSSLTGRGRANAPSYSLSSRHGVKAIEVTPGPGAYNNQDVPYGVLSGNARSRKITMAPKTNNPFHSDAPPPTSYKVKTGIGSRAISERFTPSWSLGGRNDFGSTNYTAVKSANPGPGAYGTTEPGVFKPNSGKFSLGGRTQMKDYSSLKENPGPGSYNIDGTTAKKGKGCSMGIRHSVYTMPLISDVDLI